MQHFGLICFINAKKSCSVFITNEERNIKPAPRVYFIKHKITRLLNRKIPAGLKQKSDSVFKVNVTFTVTVCPFTHEKLNRN